MHLELLNSGRLGIKGHSDHGTLRKQFETFVIPKNEKFKTRFKSEIGDTMESIIFYFELIPLAVSN